MKDLIGKTLGQYEIKDKIGQGGMAHVFKAYQPGLDRFVAIKVLSPSLAEEPGFTQRFQREAHSAARLHHPHILEVYDFGIQDKYNYLVMRYVENSTTLGDLIQQDISLDRLIDYIVQVADALNYAHERGIIHRDVKPSNILISGKWALLADFGLAKIAAASSQLTGTGTGIGTPAYMSPEQASGASVVDQRTDIYALGIILHRILTGAVPHSAPTPLAILVRRSTEPVRSIREKNPDLPVSLDHVVLRTLSMDPDSRYSTATQFAEALKKAETDPDYREESVATIPVTEGGTAIIDRSAGAGSATIASGVRTADPAWRKNLGLIAGGLVGAAVVIGVLIFLVLFLVVGKGSLAAQPTPQAQTSESSGVSAAISETSTPAPPTDTPTPIPPGTPSARAKSDLEIRTGPGDEYELQGYLPQGAMAEVISRDKAGRWWQIKTSLTTTGMGWVKSGPNFSEATGTDNVPIGLDPTPTSTTAPTPTSTSAPDTSTPTATPIPDTPTSTATPTRLAAAATPTTPASTAPTKTPTLPAGQFALLKPASLDEPTYGPTEFEWQWNGPVGADQGFEVRVWRDGEPPAGVHNAVEDNQNGKIVPLGNNTYRLTVDIREADGVRGRGGEYLWTVLLVQISPEYKDLGKQATPGCLRLEVSGGPDGDEGPSQPTD